MKQKVLNWAQRFNTFCFLDNHQYQIEPHTQECILGAGIKRKINAQCRQCAWTCCNNSLTKNETWLFGHLGYDLKNEPGAILFRPS